MVLEDEDREKNNVKEIIKDKTELMGGVGGWNIEL